MCRIAYIPKPKKVPEEKLAHLFHHLDKAMGGDGVGVAYVKGGHIYTFKGCNVSPAAAAHVARESEGAALFHTRRATTGPVCDHLCQPFGINGVAVVHNGIWRDWAGTAKELLIRGQMDGGYPINDSLAAANMAANLGRYSLEVIDSGVFVVMTPTSAHLHLRSGCFEWCGDEKIYASAFPNDWPTSKKMKGDTIATLATGGPKFEDGGFSKFKIPRIPGMVVYDPKTKAWATAWEEDDQDDGADKALEEVTYGSPEYFALISAAQKRGEGKEDNLTLEELEERLKDPSITDQEFDILYQRWMAKFSERNGPSDDDDGGFSKSKLPRILDRAHDSKADEEELTIEELEAKLDDTTLTKHEYNLIYQKWEAKLIEWHETRAADEDDGGGDYLSAGMLAELRLGDDDLGPEERRALHEELSADGELSHEELEALHDKYVS